MNQSLLVDELDLPDAVAPERRAMDSSGVLMGLMQLARRAEAHGDSCDSFDGIISKGVMRSLLTALQYRDANTVQHSRRVAQLAVGMAQHLGWDGRHLKALEVAALLHDVGKIGVPDNILLKPGKLSPDEAELMALHFNIGVDVLQACRADREVLQIISQSHIPHGTAGSDIHLGARILTVADAYDALCTPQVYRDGKSHDEAMVILQDAAGKQFDGNVVSALARWIGTNGLPDEFTPPPSSQHYLTGMNGLRPEDALEANQLASIFAYLYVLESLYDGFYLVDSDLRIIVWNRGAEKFLGFSAAEMVGQTWSRRLLQYADRFGEVFPEREIPLNRVISTGMPMSPAVRIQNAGGNWVDVEVQSVPLLDSEGQIHGVAEIFRDLSRNSCRPREFQELRLAASRDALTSVANRGELETRLAGMLREFEAAPAPAEPFSLIFLDVDFFKRINDTFGHTVGDQVLVDVARLLQNETYSGETVGRYGGEEFVVLCPATTLEAATRRAERLRTSMQKTKIGGIEEFAVTASFGATQVETGDSVESILRRADKALYMAKGGGRNRTCALTNRDLLELANCKKEQEGGENPFRFSTTFNACVASDMVVHKLAGFVQDEGATIVSVKPNFVVLRLGSRGFLPFWGGSDDRRPVEIELTIGAQTSHPGSRRASTTVAIGARIRPLGWVRDTNVFQTRARRVIKQIRSFFAAD